ncbi:MAG: hypothetical protein NT069_34825 [Planctomycetota bacterium]|nr:hypothetical protein [Planctomycetota bacterium]
MAVILSGETTVANCAHAIAAAKHINPVTAKIHSSPSLSVCAMGRELNQMPEGNSNIANNVMVPAPVSSQKRRPALCSLRPTSILASF